MTEKKSDKGYKLEELLRAYFIRAGVYAVRGIPLRFAGEDLSDVDIWLYERPTGSSRRRQIVDAKSKTKPKAIERLLWTKGLAELLKVDGCYVATTDTRQLLKDISRKLNVSVLDGFDIKRMSESDKILFPDRLSEEKIQELIKIVDKTRKSKDIQNSYLDLKSSLIDNFGSGTANRALEHLYFFSNLMITSHPNSLTAEISFRLALLSASFAAIAMDAMLTTVSFKSHDERRKTLINVIRYGIEDESLGLEKVRISTALIEKYAPNGRALSQTIFREILKDFERIPAEIIADFVVHLKMDSLFRIARSLEKESFTSTLVGYDSLTTEDKAYFGVLLDFIGIDRSSVARSWTKKPISTVISAESIQNDDSQPGPLFEVKKTKP